jgi:hypothetical protein
VYWCSEKLGNFYWSTKHHILEDSTLLWESQIRLFFNLIRVKIGYGVIISYTRGVKLLVSVDISTRAPWITQNEQHFVGGEIPHELDAQMEDH